MMEITIKGKVSEDPRDRVLAIEAVTRSICEKTGQDPAEGVMMLLTAAAHLSQKYSKASRKQTTLTLAASLGHAIVAAEGFFALRPTDAGRRALSEGDRHD